MAMCAVVVVMEIRTSLSRPKIVFSLLSSLSYHDIREGPLRRSAFKARLAHCVLAVLD
jgi:hypothetical protein